jgi:hypothetical protein
MWDPSPPTDQVSSYEVCIGTSSLSCNIRVATVNASQTSYVFSPPSGQLVYVAVRGLNSKGRGSYSTEQRFSIPSLGALTNRSTSLLTAILPINLVVSDPDGSRLTFTHTGLPPGVALNSSTGQITGTPTSAGTYNVTIFVSDGLVSVSRSFLWTVTTGTTADRTAPGLTITSHASGLVVTSANQTISGTATDSGKGGSGITIVRVNGQAATGGAASGNNTANWSRTITLTSGSNTVTVEAVDGAGNIQMQQITLQLTSSGTSSTSGSVTTTSGPLALVSLASSRTSPQPVGTSISFTATATGGRSPYQYKWWLFNGTTWTVVRDWSSSATWAWTPTKPGSSYQVGVWVRDSTMTSDIATYYKIMPFAISGTSTTTSGPLRIIAVTSNLQSPQLAGTRVTFTASAAGGVAPYQYKWWVFDGTAWKIAREWGTSNTYTWTALPRGDSYFVGVWLRDSTTNADVGNIYSMVPFVTR